LRPKALYVSSSVGLGHVTRDYRLSRLLDWADITWLTAGRALDYLRARGEGVHELSYELRSLGDSLMNVIRSCRVTYSPLGLLRLYRDLRHNADLIRDHLDLEAYDLVIGDEPWELMMSGLRIPERSVLITDITSLGSSDNLIMRRVNSWIRAKFLQFRLRFNVSLWDRAEGFLSPGQLATHEAYPTPSDGGLIVINLGGTDAGNSAAEAISALLEARGLRTAIIGGRSFRPNPVDMIAGARALVTLAGYSSLVEASMLRKRAVILKIGGHFEHEENARVFEGRSGYRVLSCDRATPEEVYRALSEVLSEEPDPPAVKDSAQEIASMIRGLIK